MRTCLSRRITFVRRLVGTRSEYFLRHLTGLHQRSRGKAWTNPFARREVRVCRAVLTDFGFWPQHAAVDDESRRLVCRVKEQTYSKIERSVDCRNTFRICGRGNCISRKTPTTL
jgi:hypothetical protein